MAQRLSVTSRCYDSAQLPDSILLAEFFENLRGSAADSLSPL